MKGILLFQSKYGATKKYAQWLSEETGFPLLETKKAKIEDVRDCEALILCGGIYATGIAGISFLRKHKGELIGKKLAVFCVGASPYSEEGVRAIAEHNLKGELSGIPCFYGRGAWDIKNMNMIDRTLCKMLRRSVSKKDPSTYEIWEEALMAAGEESCDWTEKTYLQPVLEYLSR